MTQVVDMRVNREGPQIVCAAMTICCFGYVILRRLNDTKSILEYDKTKKNSKNVDWVGLSKPHASLYHQKHY